MYYGVGEVLSMIWLRGYGILMIATLILSITAILTLLPMASASKDCFLGYKAYCTFTPISTVICLLLAGVVCKIRKLKFTE